MIAEPVVLGLLVAPSLAGLGVALLSVSAFLLRVPGLRLWRARKMPTPDPHAPRVRGFAVRVSCVALLGGGVAAAASDSPDWLVPLLLAVIPAGWALWRQTRGETRHLWPEIAAAAASSAPVASMFLASGRDPGIAYGSWGLLCLKSVLSIVFVRSQIRRFHGRPHSRVGMWLAHGAALILVVLCFPSPVFPSRGAVLGVSLLVVRAVSLSLMPVGSAKRVGWIEVGVSAVFVGLAAGF
jgi:hypothetical protein